MGINTCIVYHVYHVYVGLSVQSNHSLTLQHKQFQSGLVDSAQKPHNLILEGSNWTWTGSVTSHPKTRSSFLLLLWWVIHLHLKNLQQKLYHLLFCFHSREYRIFLYPITIPVGTFLLWMILPAFPARWNMLVSFERWAMVATCWQAAAASYDETKVRCIESMGLHINMYYVCIYICTYVYIKEYIYIYVLSLLFINIFQKDTPLGFFLSIR